MTQKGVSPQNAQRPLSSSEAISASSATSAVMPNWEWPAVIGVMLVAAAFRLLALNDVPPGLHHDEVIIGQIAKDILRGHVSIYFTPGYGHEPLYHYVLAGMFAAIGANAFVLRLTSAFVALLGIAATYRLTRRVFSPGVALGAMAWMAVTLWPIFFARVGLRGIALPLLSTLTAYFFWKALFQTPNSKLQTLNSKLQIPNSKFQILNSKFVLPGILLGLTLYTYQASRVFPIVFAILVLYLRLFHRLLFKQVWRGLIVVFFVAAIVAAPLVIYLTAVNPSAEERLSELSGPLNNLLAGDPSDVVQSTLNTFGMFSVMGDNVPIYNAGGRPVFPEPIGAAFFYAGFLLSAWRWRRPGYALLLIWFAISLAPGMVTPFSPNFVRTIASWPVPFIFSGVAMVELARFPLRRFGHSSRFTLHVITAFLTLVLAFNAVLTTRDYFFNWPRGDYVRFWQQTTWTQAARALNADPSTLPVAASGLSIQDLDPQTFDLLLKRRDFKVKWFDCRNAILFPAGGAPARYLEPDFFSCDPDLTSHYLPGAPIIAQPRWPDSGNVIFTLRQFDARALLDGALPRIASQPIYIGSERFDAADPAGGLEPLALPIDLSGLQLLGWEMDRDTWKPGETVEIKTYWKVTASLAPPLSLFVHVTRPDGSIFAQHDGLDVGVATLEPGDLFVQRHRIPLAADAAPGAVRVSLGAYHPDTDVRLTATQDGRSVDALVIGQLIW